jgi:acetyltransferase-like isoleucine patch superfamily enzyme
MLKYFIHEKAWSESKNIGINTKVWAFTHILPESEIGSECNIGEHCYIENDVIIGNDVTIKNGISIWDGITIEDKVFLGPNMVFTNDIMPRSKNRENVLVKTLVKKGASIGANATIIGGCTIGQYAMIGAGSVVTKDVMDFSLCYGNPAKHKGFICKCGAKLAFVNNNAICSCGLRYILDNNGICRLKLQ